MDFREVIVKCLSIGIYHKVRTLYEAKKNKKKSRSSVFKKTVFRNRDKRPGEASKRRTPFSSTNKFKDLNDIYMKTLIS